MMSAIYIGRKATIGSIPSIWHIRFYLVLRYTLMDVCVGREEELRYLNDLWEKVPVSCAVCGRRHLGKTTLLKEFTKDKPFIYITGTEGLRSDNLEEINRAMTEELSHVDIENDFDTALKIYEKWYGQRENNYMANETGMRREEQWSFDVYSPDAGGYAGVALRYIEIERSGKPGSMILCAPNNGAIPTLEDDDVVEITCDITPDGRCTPHRFALEDIPAGNLELIRRVKYYERLAARGIVNRSKADIVECLTMHPLVNSYSIACDLADKYIELNAPYIDGWK